MLLGVRPWQARSHHPVVKRFGCQRGDTPEDCPSMGRALLKLMVPGVVAVAAMPSALASLG